MSEESKKAEMDMELELDQLEQVSGGGRLNDLIVRITNAGKSREYKGILKAQGKAAAAAAGCADFGDLCGFCAAAVTMLK